LISACQSGCRALTIHDTDLQFMFLPLAHVLGRELEWIPVVAGCETAFAESLAKIKDNLADARPTFMAGVPRIYEKFYSGVLSGAKKGSALKVALVGWGFGGRQAVRRGDPAGRDAGAGVEGPARPGRQAGAVQAPRPIGPRPLPLP